MSINPQEKVTIQQTEELSKKGGMGVFHTPMPPFFRLHLASAE